MNTEYNIATNRKKSKIFPAATLLRKIINKYMFGIKRLAPGSKVATPQPFACKDRLEYNLNMRKFGFSFSNNYYQEHVSGANTYYYYSKFHSPNLNFTPETASLENCVMLYLDVDILKKQGKGDMEGASAAIRELERLIPGLYSEDCRRAYLFVLNDRYSSINAFNSAVMALKRKINAYLTSKCNIEKFEIMGTPCQIKRDQRGIWHAEKFGLLGKLPTQLETRLEEFTASPKVLLSDLENMQLPSVETAKSMQTAGSMSFWSEEEIEALPAVFERHKSLYYYLHCRHVAPKRQGIKLVIADYCYAHVVTDWMARNPNKDYQAPTNAVKHLWDQLRPLMVEAGLPDRAFDYSRWSALRDTFADCGLLTMIDNKYWFFPAAANDGEKKKNGKAMQWYLAEAYAVEWSGDSADNTFSLSYMREVISNYTYQKWRPKRIDMQFCVKYTDDEVDRIIKPVSRSVSRL